MRNQVQPPRRRGRLTTVAALGAIIAVMVTLVAFSVPLYRLFCAATGFGGTTQRAAAATDAVSDRVVTVRFTTEVAANLGWRFLPEQPEVKIRLGEEKLVFFSAENLTDKPVVGHATFNVTPAKAGIYFNKIQCFCFDEERLEGRQKVDMPVDFFIDPRLATDPDTSEVDTITLAYTFFRSADPTDAKDLSRFVAPVEPDPQRGFRLFAETCAACHALDHDKIGPRLAGILGRTAAAVAGFDYSPALRASGLRWTADTLNRWLAAPQALAPGTRMPLRLADPTIRRDIIAYLAAQAPQAAAAGAAAEPR